MELLIILVVAYLFVAGAYLFVRSMVWWVMELFDARAWKKVPRGKEPKDPFKYVPVGKDLIFIFDAQTGKRLGVTRRLSEEESLKIRANPVQYKTRSEG